MRRLLVIFIFIAGGLSRGWSAPLQIGLNQGRLPITAVTIASINQEGIVFSLAPGQVDYKRYHWREFSAEGLLALKRVMPNERAYQRRPVADRALFDEYVNLALAKLQPPPPPKPKPKPAPKPQPPPVRIVPAPKTVPVVAAAVPPTNSPAPTQPPPNKPLPKQSPGPDPEPKSASEFQLMQPPGVAPGTDHRPPDTGFSFSAILSPAGVFFLLIVMGFSVYAGNEIARFRNRPRSLVCAVSALCPVIGPAVFLFLPDPATRHADAMAEAHDPLALKPTEPPVTEKVEPSTKSIKYEDDPDSPYLHLSPEDAVEEETYLEPETPAPVAPQAQVLELYRAPDYEINFEFFNNYFQRFVNAAPKDGQTLVLRTADLEYPVHYITLLDAAALTVIFPSGNEWAEDSIAYDQIQEVEVRGSAV